MKRVFLTAVTLLTVANVAGCPRSTPPPTPVQECALATRVDALADSTSPIITALRDNGYFDTIAAIQAAGGVGIYDTTSATPKTIFTPTELGWTALATSLGYASTQSMLCEMPTATLKAILLFNCLPSPKSSADIASQPTLPTCLVQNGTNAIVNVNNDPATIALRDAACTVVPVRYPDIRSGAYYIHGTDRPAMPPRVLPVVDMVRSNPFLNIEVAALGSAPLDVLTALASQPSFTYFVPSQQGAEEALTSIGPTDLGLTTDQIATMLRYQIAIPAITLDSAGEVPTLAPGQSLTINTNGAPVVQTSVSTTFTTIPPSTILQTNNVGSDGNNIYCVEKVLFPIVPFCQATPDETVATTICENAATNEATCSAIKLASADGSISESACGFTAPACIVNVENETNNCAIYGNGDPANGTICLQYPAFCTWVAPVPPNTIGSCNPVGGESTDAEACATYLSGNVTADRANCNSALDPQFSMCTYVEGTCTPATLDNASNCARLINRDCVAATSGPTQANSGFCSLQALPTP